MELAPGVTIDEDVLGTFCRTNGVRRLGLFGSALRGELRPDGDIDLLVEFEPGRVPGLLHLAALELELMELLGREVDLRTAADLSQHFRDEVSASARVCITPPDDLARIAHLREGTERHSGSHRARLDRRSRTMSCSAQGCRTTANSR